MYLTVIFNSDDFVNPQQEIVRGRIFWGKGPGVHLGELGYKYFLYTKPCVELSTPVPFYFVIKLPLLKLNIASRPKIVLGLMFLKLLSRNLD